MIWLAGKKKTWLWDVEWKPSLDVHIFSPDFKNDQKVECAVRHEVIWRIWGCWVSVGAVWMKLLKMCSKQITDLPPVPPWHLACEISGMSQQCRSGATVRVAVRWIRNQIPQLSSTTAAYGPSIDIHPVVWQGVLQMNEPSAREGSLLCSSLSGFFALNTEIFVVVRFFSRQV